MHRSRLLETQNLKLVTGGGVFPPASGKLLRRLRRLLMMRGLCRQARLLAQGRGFVRSFPREVGVRTAEMPVGRGLPVNRTTQIQRLDNALRGQLEIGANQIGNLAFVNLRRAECIDQYANRLSRSEERRVGKECRSRW